MGVRIDLKGIFFPTVVHDADLAQPLPPLLRDLHLGDHAGSFRHRRVDARGGLGRREGLGGPSGLRRHHQTPNGEQ
jgi:hypothetical protein